MAGLVKTYRGGSAPAVAGVSFTIGCGEIFGLLGPNGSGKTTTVRILVTLLRQTAGTALVGGFDTSREPAQVRRLIGYAGQLTGVDDDLTVAENLAYAAMLQRIPHNESWRRAEALIGEFALAGVARQRASRLSGGLRRRLMLDKLLIAPIRRPSILFARVLADAVTMTVQAVILILIGVAMGARFRAGWPGFVVLGVFAVAFGVVWASVSNLIALRTRNAELTMVLGFFLTLPVLFLSAAFFPKPLLPGWLRAVTVANPASYVIETGQRLAAAGNAWGQDLRTLLALAITAAVFVPLTMTAFRASA